MCSSLSLKVSSYRDEAGDGLSIERFGKLKGFAVEFTLLSLVYRQKGSINSSLWEGIKGKRYTVFDVVRPEAMRRAGTEELEVFNSSIASYMTRTTELLMPTVHKWWMCVWIMNGVEITSHLASMFLFNWRFIRNKCLGKMSISVILRLFTMFPTLWNRVQDHRLKQASAEIQRPKCIIPINTI